MFTLPLEEVLISHGGMYNATASFYKKNNKNIKKKKKTPYKALGGDYLNYKDFFKNYSLGACECLFTDL